MRILMSVCLSGLVFACGADEVSRVAGGWGEGASIYAALGGEKTLPEELRDEVSWRDVIAEWHDTAYIYFANPPPDSNAEQLEIEVRGHNVERYRYGLLHRDSWCTVNDLTHEAKVGETLVLSELQLDRDGTKVLCAVPYKLQDAALAMPTFSTWRWEKNNHTALLLNNVPAVRDRKLQVEVQNSAKATGFSSYYYKVLSGRVDCLADQSAYHERGIDEVLDHRLAQEGWHTLCVTGDYENIRTHQWLHRHTLDTAPPRLLLNRQEIVFTLGDNRAAELGVWNNGGGKLLWEVVLPSNEDRHDLSWKPQDNYVQLTSPAQLLPSYALPWLEMRSEAHWSGVANKGGNEPLSTSELASGDMQKLTFRLADATNNYASWWSGLDEHTYMPYQYTKVLRFTNLASRFSTDFAVTLYIPEIQLSDKKVTLTPDNTRHIVDVRNIGLGDLRWRVKTLADDDYSGIETTAVAHQGKDAEGRMYGDGIVMIAIDEPLPTTRTQIKLEFSYMGGEKVVLPIEFVP